MDELELAVELGDIAAEIALRYFARSPETSIKKDGTLVTIADREIETAIRKRITETFPDHGILGEEEGLVGDSGAPLWVIDPIDGTNNYASGIPIFATLIALRVDGSTQIGVANAPALGEAYVGARGDGAMLNGHGIRVSDISDLAGATVVMGSFKRLLSAGYGDQMKSVMSICRRDRGFGDFWGHVLVARGAAEVMLEPDLAIWDIAALELIVEEAGGRVTGFTGEVYPESRIWGSEGDGSCLTTNGHLHAAMVEALAR